MKRLRAVRGAQRFEHSVQVRAGVLDTVDAEVPLGVLAEAPLGQVGLDAAGAAGVVKTIGTITGVGARLVSVSGDPGSVARRLNASPSVLFAEPNHIYRTAAPAFANDQRFGELHGLHNTGQNGGRLDADIGAPEGWGAAGAVRRPGDRGGQVRRRQWAGTHAAGTVGAIASNATGVAGVAFNSPLVICKALDSTGMGTLAGVANCITCLNRQGARIIALSLGVPDGTTRANAVAAATQNGSLLIAAAGNGAGATPNTRPPTRRWSRWRPSTAMTRTPRSRSRTRTSRSPLPAWTSCRRGSTGAISRRRGSRWRLRTRPAPPRSSPAAIRAGGPAAWRAKLDGSVDDLGPLGRDSQFGFGRVNLAKAASPGP